MKEKKPGVLSPELVQALGMLEGAPPPWLVNMQRYGPPPSYPHLKIPGLNAPIPEGSSYGYHPGGWGKPPVDEYGRPLYGDVFGTFAQAEQALRESIDRSHWGELGAMSSESEESSESEAEEEEADQPGHPGRVVDSSGVETPMTLSGMSSVTSGLETPDTIIDLRKREGGTETPDLVGSSRELYQVIQEKKPSQGGQAIYGSDRAYVLPSKDGDAAGDENGTQGSSSHNPAEGAGGDDEDERNDTRAKRKRRTESSTTAKRQKDFRF
jgi:splicing factor 3B subunit 2